MEIGLGFHARLMRAQCTGYRKDIVRVVAEWKFVIRQIIRIIRNNCAIASFGEMCEKRVKALSGFGKLGLVVGNRICGLSVCFRWKVWFRVVLGAS